MYEKIKSWISNNRFLIGMGVGTVLFLACYLFSEPVYMLTETELVTLEQNSNRQLEISSQLAQELQTAKKQLKASEKESTKPNCRKSSCRSS